MASENRYATLVGCLYKKTPYELKGCINDVTNMKTMLTGSFGFKNEHISVLTDEAPVKPTQENIMNALNGMISKARSKDVLFFYFSGHGTWVQDDQPGHEQALVPLDISPLITRTDLNELVNRVPKGASFTILSDSGHSGGLINNDSLQSGGLKVGPSQGFQDTSQGNLISKTLPANLLQSLPGIQHTSRAYGDDPVDVNGILLSACQEYETAIEVVPPKDQPYGVFTHAILQVLTEEGATISNSNLVTHAMKRLHGQHFRQNPGLYCSKGDADAIFLSPPKS